MDKISKKRRIELILRLSVNYIEPTTERRTQSVSCVDATSLFVGFQTRTRIFSWPSLQSITSVHELVSP